MMKRIIRRYQDFFDTLNVFLFIALCFGLLVALFTAGVLGVAAATGG